MFSASLFRLWLSAFVFTQMIEAPIYVLAFERERNKWARVGWAYLPSLVSHPIVFFGFRPLRMALGFWGYVAVAEIFAVLLEAWILKARGIASPLRWSLVANAASMGVGYASHLALGWP